MWLVFRVFGVVARIRVRFPDIPCTTHYYQCSDVLSVFHLHSLHGFLLLVAGIWSLNGFPLMNIALISYICVIFLENSIVEYILQSEMMQIFFVRTIV